MEIEKQKVVELEKLIREFRSYKRLLQNESRSKNQEGYMYSLRSTLQRKVGTYRDLIVGLTGKEWASEQNYRFDFWTEALRADGLKSRTLNSIETCIQSINEAIGKLEAEPIVQEEQGYLESPIQLFDALQFHPRVVEASRELFKDGHYRDAIYRAFVEVNNFVKDKSNKQLDGKRLMSTVFSLDNPIIKLNELKNQTDKDEQEGFMFLFMGAMEGIRNPKAHLNIIQKDPYRTLEYLALASLLMKIAEEGHL